MATAAGYSGTPLGKKLGYREAMRVYVDAMPDPIRHAIEKSLGEKPDWHFVPDAEIEAAHLFVTDRSVMETKVSPVCLAVAARFSPTRFSNASSRSPRVRVRASWAATVAWNCPPSSP